MGNIGVGGSVTDSAGDPGQVEPLVIAAELWAMLDDAEQDFIAELGLAGDAPVADCPTRERAFAKGVAVAAFALECTMAGDDTGGEPTDAQARLYSLVGVLQGTAHLIATRARA